MTDQYQQLAINEQQNPILLEIDSLDSRNVPGLVPAGTTATIVGPRERCRARTRATIATSPKAASQTMRVLYSR